MWTSRKITTVIGETPDETLPPQRVRPLDNVVLPPYSGKRVKCVKCGGNGAFVKHQAENIVCHHPLPIEGCPTSYTYGRERLHRECATCGWSWDELCYTPEEPHVGIK